MILLALRAQQWGPTLSSSDLYGLVIVPVTSHEEHFKGGEQTARVVHRGAPLRDGEVIAHSKQPLSYCLLLSFEGRRRNLLLHFQLIFQWDVGIPEQHCAGITLRVLGLYSNKAYRRPRGTQHTHCLFIYLLYLCLHFSAPAACHNWRVDRHVCGDVHDRNLFSSRFTLDTGNATLLMATRPHPGKPSRAEWETGWRSCWISSRMSICPSGERRVSFQTVCTL